MASEHRINKFCLIEMGLTKENGVTTTPTEACDTDLSVGVEFAEFGEKGFDDGNSHGLTMPIEPRRNPHERFRKGKTTINRFEV
jgi:hypothetical protein